MDMALAVTVTVLGAAVVLIGLVILLHAWLYAWALRLGGREFAERLVGDGRDEG